MRRWSLILVVLVLFTTPAFGSIIGDTIQVDWWFPSVGSVYWTGSTTVPGSVFPGSGVPEIEVYDGTIIVTNETQGWTGSSGFNGFVFTDLSQVPNFTSFALVSIAGFAPPVDPILSYDADQLFVNFNASGDSNIASGSGQVYTFSYTYGAAPIPGSLLLLLSGLGALAGLRKKLS